MAKHVPMDKQQRAFHDGNLVGETLAVALPHVRHAAHLDQASEIADDHKLTGIEREEFLKGVGWGFAGKKYAIPD